MKKTWVKGIATILGNIMVIGLHMVIILIRWDDLKDYFEDGGKEA